MQKYNSNPGALEGRPWTLVWIGDRHFERLENSSRSDRMEMARLTAWAEDNLAADSWQADGVSRFSYRFWFRNSEDALMFKLATGIT